VSELRERDFRAALDFVGEVHHAQSREEFRSVLLHGYRNLVPAEHISYNEIEGEGRVAAAIVEPELPAWAYPAWERYAGENPLLQRYLRTRDGRALRFSDVISPEQLRSLPLYERLYGPLGVDHQIAFILPSTAELTIAIAMTRAKVDFDERDRKLLELTRPHMIQAYRAAELRERLASTVTGLRSGLNADGTAIVLLDPDGSVGFASAAALELVEQAPDASLEEGRPLPRHLADWVAEGHSSGSIDVGGEALLLRRFRSDGRTVLLLDDAGRALSLVALGELGLTGREAAVLHEFARGAQPAAVGSSLGISPRTVAKHMQRVHAKLGVANRAEAVATAWAATGASRTSEPLSTAE
jgi:DNA-binding CsgD family transcriptional regulator